MFKKTKIYINHVHLKKYDLICNSNKNPQKCLVGITVYIWRCTYVTTFITAGTLRHKGGGVRPQPFLGLQAIFRIASIWNVGRVKHQWWILAQLLKETLFAYCLTFCFLTTALTSVAKVSQLYTRARSAVTV